jgi:hypothetical protein
MRRREPKDMYEYAMLCKACYEQDNDWAKQLQGGILKFDVANVKAAAVAAANAYGRIPKDRDATLLLGDTKIRSDAELMLNFGISGTDGDKPRPETCAVIAKAMGIKDPKPNLTVDDLREYRAKINAGQGANTPGKPNELRGAPLARAPFEPARMPGEDFSKDVPLFGPGSLLSNPEWTPMLNDAFILGGLHTNLTFVVALNTDEQKAWSEQKASAMQSLIKRFGSMTEPAKARLARESWANFIRDYQDGHMLWDRKLNIPRVFLRELLGLRAFGYTAKFSEYQLSFECTDAGKADEANFFPYVDMLANIGFKDASKKASILKAISEWLFEDDSALSKLAA